MSGGEPEDHFLQMTSKSKAQTEFQHELRRLFSLEREGSKERPMGCILAALVGDACGAPYLFSER